MEIERRVQDAARTVVMTKGFDGARLSDVARIAAVSPAAIYRFAAGRDELLAGVVRRVSAKERDAFRSSLARHAEAAEAVRAATRRFVERAFRGDAIAMALLTSSAVPAVDRARTETRSLLADVLRDRLGDRHRAVAIVGTLLAVLADVLQGPVDEREAGAKEISAMCASLVGRAGR